MKIVQTSYKCDHCGKDFTVSSLITLMEDEERDFCSTECLDNYIFEKEKQPINYKAPIERRVEFFSFRGDIYYEDKKITHVFKLDDDFHTSGTQDNILVVCHKGEYWDVPINFHRYKHNLDNVYSTGMLVDRDVLRTVLTTQSDFKYLDPYLYL